MSCLLHDIMSLFRCVTDRLVVVAGLTAVDIAVTCVSAVSHRPQRANDMVTVGLVSFG